MPYLRVPGHARSDMLYATPLQRPFEQGLSPADGDVCLRLRGQPFSEEEANRNGVYSLTGRKAPGIWLKRTLA
jgi:hypothetical protein